MFRNVNTCGPLQTIVLAMLGREVVSPRMTNLVTLVTAISLSREWLPGRKIIVVSEVRKRPCAYSERVRQGSVGHGASGVDLM